MQPYVEYHYPKEVEGKLVHHRARITVSEAVRLQRASGLAQSYVYPSDELALSDFIVVHWATLHGREYPVIPE
jgi:hypothetical protein